MNIKKLVALSAGTALLLTLIWVNPLRVFDNFFYGLNFRFHSPAPCDSVVIVGIDAKSINEIGGWKWPRATLAQLFDRIEQGSPRTVALDFLFPKSDDSLGNDSLARVLGRMRSPVLAYQAGAFAQGADMVINGATQSVEPHRFMILPKPEELAARHFYSASEVFVSDTLFSRHAARMGFANVSTDRRTQRLLEVIHVMKIGAEFYPSFGLAAVASYWQLGPGEMILDRSAQVVLGTRLLPLSSYAASSFLNYRGAAGTVPTISAADVLSGRYDVSQFRDKLVFVGITAPGIIDFLPTPVGPRYPGVEAWATSAIDILSQSWVRYGGGLGAVFNLLLALLVFPGIVLLIPPKARVLSVCAALLAIAVSIGLSFVLFNSVNYFWNPGGQIIAGLLLVGWMALRKADPSFEGGIALEIEPAEDDTLEQLNPPQSGDYIARIPQLHTAFYVVKKLGVQTGEWSAEQLIGAAPTSVGSDTTLDGALQLSDSARALMDTMDVSPESLEQFRKLSNGTIVGTLGSGGMADVYLVWNPRLEVYRAVKVLKPGQPASMMSRFETEIRIFSKLNHPNIVHCYGVGEWYELPCVEMEYVNGTSFENILSRLKTLSAVQCLAVGILMCRALRYAHNQTITIYGNTYKGLIHRDIKPANILISRSGRVKLTDFGIARPVQVSLHTQDHGNIVGTLPYLAPEQMDGAEVTVRADIYALGATMYEFLAGRRAFGQNDMTALIRAKSMGEVAPLPNPTRLPRGLEEIIKKSMAVNPDERYQSCEQLCEALEHSLRTVVRTPSAPELRALACAYFGDGR
jgi:serine/threonine-protein kinase